MFVYESTEIEVKGTEEAFELFWKGKYFVVLLKDHKHHLYSKAVQIEQSCSLW